MFQRQELTESRQNYCITSHWKAVLVFQHSFSISNVCQTVSNFIFQRTSRWFLCEMMQEFLETWKRWNGKWMK